jgi:hypothetical protein
MLHVHICYCLSYNLILFLELLLYTQCYCPTCLTLQSGITRHTCTHVAIHLVCARAAILTWIDGAFINV